MDRGEIDPVRVGMKGVFDFRGVDSDVVVVIGAPQRMHAIRTQRHLVGGPGGGAAQRGFERDRTAFDAGFVADLDVPARQTGVAAHGPPVLLRRFVVFQHRLDHERRQIALLGVGAASQTGQIVVGNLDGRLGHQVICSAFQRGDSNHDGLVLRARFLCRSSPRKR